MSNAPPIVYDRRVFRLTCGPILKGHFTNDKLLLINSSTITHARLRTSA